MFLWAQQDIKTMTPGTWNGTHGRVVDWIYGAESAAGRRAWVSGVISRERRAWVSRGRQHDLPQMAGSVSRGRRRHLPRTAGSVSRGRRRHLLWTAGWVSCGQRRHLPQTAGSGERLAWDCRGRRRISPVIGGLEGATDSGGLLPRSAGWRARGQRTRGTHGDSAELPRRLDVG